MAHTQKINKNLLKFILIILLFLPLYTVSLHAQTDAGKLVKLPLLVMDREGRYVPDLEKENFQLFQDENKKEIDFFEPANVPFTVLFLIDTSSSMSIYKPQMAVALNELSKRLRPEDNMMAVIFDRGSEKVLDLTQVGERPPVVKLNIRHDADCPDTYLYNAVDDALNRMKKISGRKAIFLLTDGNGGGFGITAKDNYRKALENEAIFYTFKFGEHSAEPLYKFLNRESYFENIEKRIKYMSELARITGGRSYLVEEIQDIDKTLTPIIKELGMQYVIGYSSKEKSEADLDKNLRVLINKPGMAVRMPRNQ